MKARVEQLIWGLMLVHSTDAPTLPPVTSGASILPRAYALLKLAFLSGPLVAYINERGEKSWRIARGGTWNTHSPRAAGHCTVANWTAW